MNLSPATLDWLLNGPAWVRLCTQRDLLPASSVPPSTGELHEALLQDAGFCSILDELSAWPGPALNSHKSAGHPLHKLVWLADLGLTVAFPEILALAEMVLATASVQGPFRVLMNISTSYGGSGEDGLAWALCDAPLSLYACASFGLHGHPAVQKAASFLVELGRTNGWPCAVAPELGKFRGPGRKEDPCPYANLVMLQALAAFPEYHSSTTVRAGVEIALTLWAERQERHPYMFYMGTDFCKLKAPLVWYDLMHVTDVLTRYPWTLDDPRLQDMLQVLRAKAGPDGRFTPESVWTAWKDWDCGQKKVPSRWLTFLAGRILQRATPANAPG